MKIMMFLLHMSLLLEQEIIRPSLERGIIVVSNRHKYSTDAYQSAQGVPLEDLKKLQESKGVGTPDLTLFLDVDKENLRRRMQASGTKLDKFERSLEFQQKVAVQYIKIYLDARKPKTG